MLTFNTNRAADTLPRECVGAESMLSLVTPTSAHIASLHQHHHRQHHLSYAASFLGHTHFLPPPPSWFLSPPSSSSSPAPSDGQAPGWKSPPPDDEKAPPADTEVDLMNGGGQQGPLPPRSGQVGHNAPLPSEHCSPYNGGESLHWLADVAAHHRTPVSGTPPTPNQELYPIRPRMYAPPPLYVGLPPFYANPALPSTASYSAFYSPATMLHPPRGGAFAGISPPSHAMGRGLCAPPPSSNPPNQIAPLSFGDDSGGFRRFPPPSPTLPAPAFNAPPPQPATPPTKGVAIEGREGSLKHRFLSTRTSSSGGSKGGLEDIKEEERTTEAHPSATPIRRRRGVTKRLPGSRTRLLYPAHFTRGSMIQLATGELKRVEDMRTDDFVASADASHHLKIDSSTVVRVDSRSITDDEDDDADVGGGGGGSSRQVALLGFSVGERRVQVTVEAALEHPFFVFGQGWSSCCPERTKSRYGLTCSKLQVGDVCVSLTHKPRPHTDTATPPPSCPSSSSAEATPPDATSRKRRWSAPEAEPDPADQTPPTAPPNCSSS